MIDKFLKKAKYSTAFNSVENINIACTKIPKFFWQEGCYHLERGDVIILE